MNLEELKLYISYNEEIDDLLEELGDFKGTILAERRKPTDSEREYAFENLAKVERLEVKRDALGTPEEYRQACAEASKPMSEPTRPDVNINGGFDKMKSSEQRKVTDTEIPPLYAGEDKSYRNMFHGDTSIKLEDGGFKNNAELYAALISGKYDERLVRANQIEGIMSDGGFSVSPEQTALWLDNALEDEIIRKLATVWPMKSLERKIPGFDGPDRSSGEYFGGLQMEILPEEGSRTKKTAKLRMITLKAKKGVIYTDMSNELKADGLGFADQLQMALRKAIARGMDNEFINGTGAGRPQGILSSPSLIQVSKETGQDADTILYPNIAKQYARMYPAGRKRAVWLASDTCIPQLLQLGVEVGTGGGHIPVLKENSGNFTILGRPVYFTELMPTVGNANDIVFCDCSQYCVGLRKEISIDVSNAPGWTQDLTSLRVIVRFDGQGSWAKAITPRKGDSQSWVVGIAERA